MSVDGIVENARRYGIEGNPENSRRTRYRRCPLLTDLPGISAASPDSLAKS